MADFFTLFNTSTSEIPTPFIYMKPEKDNLSGGASPYWPSLGVSPPPPSLGLHLLFHALLVKTSLTYRLFAWGHRGGIARGLGYKNR